MAARLKDYYKNTVFSGLMDKFQYKNAMEVPKLEKITLNMGLGGIKDNQKMLETAAQELAIISGQKPVMTKAKKSIACNHKTHIFELFIILYFYTVGSGKRLRIGISNQLTCQIIDFITSINSLNGTIQH